MGHVGISLPSDVTPNERPSRAPNCRPFKQLKVNNDIYKYSFYPRTVVLWNNISLSSSNIVNIDIFRSNALSFIRSVQPILILSLRYYIILFYPSFVFLSLLNLKLYKNYLILLFVISPSGIVITVSGVSRLKITYDYVSHCYS